MIKHYYVVFDKKRHNFFHWFDTFCTDEFSHCFILTDAGKNKTVKLEPMFGGTILRVIDMNTEAAIAEVLDKGVTAVLSYTLDTANLHKPTTRGILTCVSVVKAVLYIKDGRFVLTPFQLYKYLLHNDAEVVKPFVPYLKK